MTGTQKEASLAQAGAAVPESQLGFSFKRTEVKYRIPKDVYPVFMQAMEPWIVLDEYGLSTICNIYYDTDGADLISRSLSKPAYKEKLRMRSYGVPGKDSTVYCEIKKKYDGVVYKRRAALPCAEAEAFLNDGRTPKEDSQIIRELAYVRDFYKPQPALFLAYDREAFMGRHDPSMRMTIDRNIRYRTDHLSLTDGDAGKRLDVNGDYLLEVKVNGALPLEIVKIMNDLKIYPASFSKYGAIYQEMNSNAKPAAAVQAGRRAAKAASAQRTAGRRKTRRVGRVLAALAHHS